MYPHKEPTGGRYPRYSAPIQQQPPQQPPPHHMRSSTYGPMGSMGSIGSMGGSIGPGPMGGYGYDGGETDYSRFGYGPPLSSPPLSAPPHGYRSSPSMLSAMAQERMGYHGMPPGEHEGYGDSGSMLSLHGAMKGRMSAEYGGHYPQHRGSPHFAPSFDNSMPPFDKSVPPSRYGYVPDLVDRGSYISLPKHMEQQPSASTQSSSTTSHSKHASESELQGRRQAHSVHSNQFGVQREESDSEEDPMVTGDVPAQVYHATQEGADAQYRPPPRRNSPPTMMRPAPPPRAMMRDEEGPGPGPGRVERVDDDLEEDASNLLLTFKTAEQDTVQPPPPPPPRARSGAPWPQYSEPHPHPGYGRSGGSEMGYHRPGMNPPPPGYGSYSYPPPPPPGYGQMGPGGYGGSSMMGWQGEPGYYPSAPPPLAPASYPPHGYHYPPPLSDMMDPYDPMHAADMSYGGGRQMHQGVSGQKRKFKHKEGSRAGRQREELDYLKPLYKKRRPADDGAAPPPLQARVTVAAPHDAPPKKRLLPPPIEREGGRLSGLPPTSVHRVRALQEQSRDVLVNASNPSEAIRNRSSWIGVSYVPRLKKFRSFIFHPVHRKTIGCGTHPTAYDAAKARHKMIASLPEDIRSHISQDFVADPLDPEFTSIPPSLFSSLDMPPEDEPHTAAQSVVPSPTDPASEHVQMKEEPTLSASPAAVGETPAESQEALEAPTRVERPTALPSCELLQPSAVPETQ